MLTVSASGPASCPRLHLAIPLGPFVPHPQFYLHFPLSLIFLFLSAPAFHTLSSIFPSLSHLRFPPFEFPLLFFSSLRVFYFRHSHFYPSIPSRLFLPTLITSISPALSALSFHPNPTHLPIPFSSIFPSPFPSISPSL